MYTPGPWEVRKAKQPVDGAFDFAIGADFGDSKHCIAEAFGMVSEGCPAPAEANARLIAASPDMLKALEKIASGWPGTEASTIAIHAIAKAKGE